VIRYQSAVVIDRPPSDVFPYLVEREKQALWSDVEMRPLSDGPFGAGFQMELNMGMGPLRAVIVMEITELVQDRRVAWRTVSGPIQWTGEYSLAPDGPSGARLSQEGELRFTGLWRLLEPIAGAEIRTAEIKELERLKAAAESR